MTPSEIASRCLAATPCCLLQPHNLSVRLAFECLHCTIWMYVFNGFRCLNLYNFLIYDFGKFYIFYYVGSSQTTANSVFIIVCAGGCFVSALIFTTLSVHLVCRLAQIVLILLLIPRELVAALW